MVKRVLVLDGGGVRGVISLKFLSLLERETGINVSQYFDFFAGTSTGGLIATLFAYKKMSATEILEQVYTLQNVTKIMSQGYYEWALSQIQVRSKYSDIEKIKFIGQYVDSGGTTRLRDIDTPLLLVAFNPVEKLPLLFRNYFHGPNYLLGEACNATSAAPTYFPIAKVTIPDASCASSKTDASVNNRGNDVESCDGKSHKINAGGADRGDVKCEQIDQVKNDQSGQSEQIDQVKNEQTGQSSQGQQLVKSSGGSGDQLKGGSNFCWAIDGGIFANNPSDLAYLDAKQLFKGEKLEILSVGTGISKSKFGFRKITNPALGGWDWMIDDNIIDLLLDSSQVSSHIRTKQLCRENGDQYLRVNEYLLLSSIALDNTTEANYKRLLEEGELWWRLYSEHSFIKGLGSQLRP